MEVVCTHPDRGTLVEAKQRAMELDDSVSALRPGVELTYKVRIKTWT
jgi:hypothetical protein